VIPGMNFLTAFAAGSQRKIRRVLVCAALGLASALAAAVGLGFATYALFYAWRLQYGVVNASLGLSAIYLVLAGVLYLSLRSAGASQSSTVNHPAAGFFGESDAVKASGQTGDAQVAALAAGAEIAKQLTPLQLALLAAISGFVAGRKL
jgi:hypothetical protein